MIYNYPYLKDSNFLRRFDLLRLKTQFVKVTLLTFDTERPVLTIEGRSLSGSININGKSAVRRTGNISLLAAAADNDFEQIESKVSINKKVEIEIGFLNNTDEYTDFEKIWFPQGVFVISNVSYSHSNAAAITINLQLKDKMVLLNGECGGTFPAAVCLSDVDTIDAYGNETTVKVPIVEIIREIVNHFGKEALGRILISDVDEKIPRILHWTSDDTPLYIYPDKDDKYQYHATTTQSDAENYCTTNFPDIPNAVSLISKKEYHDLIGFERDWFVYMPQQFNVTAGQTVCNALDSLNSYLGNAYEYFYDINGNFVWQEIKNYLVTSQATMDLEHVAAFEGDDYLLNRTNGRVVYAFDDSSQVSAYNNNPQWTMIKNDFMVWGERKNKDLPSGKVPIRYHLAIDDKPSIYDENGDIKTFEVVEYEDNHFISPIYFEKRADFPKIGSFDTYYFDATKTQTYVWLPLAKFENEVAFSDGTYQEPENNTYDSIEDLEEYVEEYIENGSSSDLNNLDVVEINGEYFIFYYDKTSKKGGLYLWDNDKKIMTWYKLIATDTVFVQANDWRTALYMEGAVAYSFGVASNDYYEELKNEWPKIYNMKASGSGTKADPYKGAFKTEAEVNFTSLDYFLDFIDVNSKISELKISNIGRRSKVINDNNINCLFEPVVPDLYVIDESVLSNEEIQLAQEWAINSGQNYIILDSDFWSNIENESSEIDQNGANIAVNYNSAFETIKQQLYTYTNYNQSISLTMLPIYYLEPNIRIRVRDIESNIYGDYMINTITVPLDINSSMSLTATKALDRF